MSRSSDSRQGALLAGAAFLLWGLYPFYFKALAAIDPVEVIAHRILWSLPVLAIAVLVTGRTRELIRALRNRRMLLAHLLTAALILVNWLTYVLAVVHGHVLDTSLGYFLCPLAAVLLGVLVLGERLGRWQTLAVLLAFLAVANLVWQMQSLPVVALILAASFSVYGLLRKKLEVSPLIGLLLECLLSLPLALVILGWRLAQGTLGMATASSGELLLLLASGVVTVGPLLLFNLGAKRTSYATVGLLQYIAPSMLFLEGVLLFGEPLQTARLIAFLVIWLALLIYTADGLGRARR